MSATQTIRSGPPACPAVHAPARCAGRSGALKLLSSMYLCQPSRQAITVWKSLLGDGSAALDELVGAVNAIDAASDKILEDLLWDYTRLFIGPYKLPCPPWESVYRSPARLMLQDAALDARRTYAAFGLSVEETGVMPDHVGVELNFLALASERAGEPDAKQFDWIRIAQAFADDHLLQWVPQFTADLEAAAESSFYRTLARATRATLAEIGAGVAPLRMRNIRE